MRSRINRWYTDLQAIEEEIQARDPKADVSATLEELDRLECSGPPITIGDRSSALRRFANELQSLFSGRDTNRSIKLKHAEMHQMEVPKGS